MSQRLNTYIVEDNLVFLDRWKPLPFLSAAPNQDAVRAIKPEKRCAQHDGKRKAECGYHDNRTERHAKSDAKPASATSALLDESSDDADVDDD